MLAYVVDVAPANRVSQSASATVDVGKAFTIESSLSVASASGEPGVRSGSLGLARQLHEAVDLRIGASLSKSGDAKPEVGATASLGLLLSQLWNGRCATRFTATVGGSQSYVPDFADPFGLDSRIYGYSVSGDLSQEIAPGFAVGAGYARYGDTTGPDGRDTVTFSITASWPTISAAVSTTSSSYLVGGARLQSAGLSLTYAHPAGWSIGAHGAVSENPELKAQGSGGLDVGFRW